LELLAPVIEGDSIVGVRPKPYGRRSVDLTQVERIEIYGGSGASGAVALAAAISVSIVVGIVVANALVPHVGAPP
jgi:hypothetical protein